MGRNRHAAVPLFAVSVSVLSLALPGLRALEDRRCPGIINGTNIVVGPNSSISVAVTYRASMSLPAETIFPLYGLQPNACDFDGVVAIAGSLSLHVKNHCDSYERGSRRAAHMFFNRLEQVHKRVLVNGLHYGDRIHWVGDGSSATQVANAAADAIGPSNVDVAFGPHSSGLSSHPTQQVTESSANRIFTQNNLMFGILLVVLVVCCLCKMVHRSVRALRAEDDLLAQKEARIQAAADAITDVGSTVCFCPYKSFLRHGRLIPHELACQMGDLVFLDTYVAVNEFVADHLTLFISHQWLGSKEPDPCGVHYSAACDAASALCSKFVITEDDLYLWVDYFSIPQENLQLQTLSIQSIGVCSSVTQYFVTLCPSCTHNDTSLPCDLATYQQRGWCRLEQWARMAAGGLDDMYVYAEGVLSPFRQHPEKYKDSIHVFAGDFTSDSDKYTLVDTILGLWAMCSAQNLEHPELQELHSLICKHRATVFPVRFFDDLIEVMDEAPPKMERLQNRKRQRNTSHTHDIVSSI